MSDYQYIRFFEEFGIDDVPLVGGKNASLGEMYRKLSEQGVRVPNGFAITAEAYTPHAGRGRRLGRAARRPRRSRPRRRHRSGAQGKRAREIVYGAGLPGRPGRRDPRRLPHAAGGVRRGASAWPCAARRPPRTCRQRASPASRTPTSTSRATRACSTPAAAASPACSPTAPSTTGSTRASTTSRSRCRSA